MQHFKVLKDREGQYYIWDEAFSSLNQLVDFYKSNSIAREMTVFLCEAERSQRVRWKLKVLMFYDIFIKIHKNLTYVLSGLFYLAA